MKRGRGAGDEKNATEDVETATIDVAGGTMKGIIERPESEGPYPVALIHAGSGPTDKDGNSMTFAGKNNSLKLLAEELAENGIASIRYDKRILGDNQALTPEPNDVVIEDFVGDAATWLAYAQEHNDFKEVVMIGHSEGALIGTIAGTQQQVNAMVLIAGPGRPLDEILLEQYGADPQVSDDLLQEIEMMLEEIKKGEVVEEMSDELVSTFHPSVQPYLTSLLAYDPSEELAKVEVPILVMNGTTDLQVKEEDADRLTEANSLAELQLIEGMNHVLKEAPEDREENFETYGNQICH
ncbi:alpha/beta fold hydrolase [Bacillus sp. JCM 19041]|uniref:alpha/beta hydrolase n=1 Tax=Bacillus sp. JCM 19041 TaxID=1460637 RepID=UPI0006CF91F2